MSNSTLGSLLGATTALGLLILTIEHHEKLEQLESFLPLFMRSFSIISIFVVVGVSAVGERFKAKPVLVAVIGGSILFGISYLI